MAIFTGTSPAQVPTNSDLGTVAYQNADNLKVTGGLVRLEETVTKGYYQEVDTSDSLPSLMLDFGKTKALDPRISFSRASTATYYDGKTFAKTEENLLDWSQDFSTNSNRGGNAIALNAGVAPDGTLTASHFLDTFIGHANSYINFVRYTVVNDVCTFSIYAKSITRSQIAIRTSNAGGDFYSYFDISSGTVVSIGSGHTASILSIGNGWYRCSVTSIVRTSAANSWMVYAAANGALATLAGGLFEHFLWGAQLEKRAFAGPYTPTFGTPVSNTVPQLMTAAANVARFNHDPVTLESKGLLIEKQSTNLLTYSEDFRNTAMAGSTRDWSITADMIISPNSAIAPDGTMTAQLLTAGVTAATIVQTKALTGTYACFSVYAKKGSGPNHYNSFILRNNTAATNLLVIDVNYDTGSITYVTGTSGANMVSVGGGWWRISLRAAFTTGNDCKVYVGSGVPTGQSAYIWGAQLEASAFPSSYIKTEAAQATRIADLATMPTAGWYRQDEGSIYSEADCMSSYSSGVTYQFTDGYPDVNNISGLGSYSATIDFPVSSFYINTNNTARVLIIATAIATRNVLIKHLDVYKLNDAASCRNGLLIGTDSATDLPIVNMLIIGGRQGSAANLSGHIRKLAYYPKRLSNTECQQRTVIDG